MPHRNRVVPLPTALILLAGLPACSPGDTPDLRKLESLRAPPGRPSGAKVRVLNAYAPASGEPFPLDLYPGSFFAEGEKPLITVPYGTLSEYFDPTVADEQGNMTLVAYPAGQNQTTGGRVVMSWTATLKGGEAITYYLTSGRDVDSEGRTRANLFTYDNEITGDEPRPGAGKGLLMVHGAGLYDALPDPNSSLFYFSAGEGCARSYYEEAASPWAQPIAHAGGPFYQLDPGTVGGSIHQGPAGSTEPPDCRTAPVLTNLPIRVTAGEQGILFIFGPKAGNLRSLFVPLVN